MKKTVLLSMAVLALAGSSFAQGKIVFVSFERVFNEFYKTGLAKSKIEAQQKDVEAERKLLVDELTAISAEIDVLKKDARDVTLAEEVRDSKRKLYEERLLDLRAKQKELEEFTATRKKQLEVQVSRMSRIIMDEISQTVIDYAKKEGFSAVIDSSSRGAVINVFVYVHSEVDITNKILTLLNSKRPDSAEDLFDKAAEVEEEPAAGK
ncbi:MAG: OmpH family outer membrane protein [Pontiellaceae bacterium]|nr:OmpH family outer membrane protein [Pontiellaceae bacterium]